MKVYLAQHGRCTTEEENAQKPLTEEGRKECEIVGGALARAGAEVRKIVHSPKLRARQSAEIFAKKLNVENVQEIEGVKALDDPAIIAQKIEDGMMIVGHLPHLSKLCALLTGSNENVRFSYGGVLCLEKEEGELKIKWFVTPDVLR